MKDKILEALKERGPLVLEDLMEAVGLKAEDPEYAKFTDALGTLFGTKQIHAIRPRSVGQWIYFRPEQQS